MEGMACAYREERQRRGEEEVHMRLQDSGGKAMPRHVSSGNYIMKPAVLDKKDCQCLEMSFVSQETEKQRSYRLEHLKKGSLVKDLRDLIKRCL